MSKKYFSLNRSGLLSAVFAFCLITFLFAQGIIPFLLPVAYANETAQAVPLTQNWSNASLITVDDDWSLVPGIVGYRGDEIETTIGVDPQTILADGSGTPVDVNANNADPTGATSGGVYEFTTPDPTIGMQGSGTSDVPHIVINLNTSGTTAINVAYNLRDLDLTDAAVQQFALQYRVGNTGGYTNLPAGHVADASGDGAATLVTPVSAALPAACDNQPLVQVRILTVNAFGNDAMIGIDDINITGTGGGTVNLSGVGAATPSNVPAGTGTLLTVTVTPANTPPSTGITVNANLSTIAGSSSQTFFDNATNGDVTAGDNVFSFAVTIGAGEAAGIRVLPASIADAQARTANTNITLTVTGGPPPADHLLMGNPSGAVTDVNFPTNYLMSKPQYALSYHRDRGIPNWVSWHLNPLWLGTAPRQDDFREDPTLPAGWFRVQDNSYSGSGFDRGHHCPSGDRTNTVPDNSATFLMTNMMPQAPLNNQGPWAALEEYSRTMVDQGNELYIIMGGAGQGGVGSGGAANTIAGGNVTVPAFNWKVILVIPNGVDDVNRVFKTTRTIAVIMPNTQSATADWRTYRTSVDAVERLTGYNFFSNVRPQIQRIIESRVDRVP
jgi:endonuclease G, mitochondrial